MSLKSISIYINIVEKKISRCYLTNQSHTGKTSNKSTAEVQFSPPPICITSSGLLFIDQLNDTAEISISNEENSFTDSVLEKCL